MKKRAISLTPGYRALVVTTTDAAAMVQPGRVIWLRDEVPSRRRVTAAVAKDGLPSQRKSNGHMPATRCLSQKPFHNYPIFIWNRAPGSTSEPPWMILVDGPLESPYSWLLGTVSASS